MVKDFFIRLYQALRPKERLKATVKETVDLALRQVKVELGDLNKITAEQALDLAGTIIKDKIDAL